LKRLFSGKIILVIILLGLVIPLGIITLYISSIFVFGYFIFSVFTYRLENVEKPITEARRLSKGAFWRIIGALLISYMITYAVNIIYTFALTFYWPVSYSTYLSWLNPVNRKYGMLIIYILVTNIPSIILEPLFICLLTPIFASMKAKNEVGFTYGKGYYPSEVKPISQPEFTEKGIFCPFCGNHMEFKLNYCPNCGKSLNFEFKQE
jgi:hypothetical protein